MFSPILLCVRNLSLPFSFCDSLSPFSLSSCVSAFLCHAPYPSSFTCPSFSQTQIATLLVFCLPRSSLSVTLSFLLHLTSFHRASHFAHEVRLMAGSPSSHRELGVITSIAAGGRSGFIDCADRPYRDLPFFFSDAMDPSDPNLAIPGTELSFEVVPAPAAAATATGTKTSPRNQVGSSSFVLFEGGFSSHFSLFTDIRHSLRLAAHSLPLPLSSFSFFSLLQLACLFFLLTRSCGMSCLLLCSRALCGRLLNRSRHSIEEGCRRASGAGSKSRKESSSSWKSPARSWTIILVTHRTSNQDGLFATRQHSFS